MAVVMGRVNAVRAKGSLSSRSSRSMRMRSVRLAATSSGKRANLTNEVQRKAVGVKAVGATQEQLGRAVPTAVLSLATSAAASHAATLNEISAIADISNPLLPVAYFGGLFGMLGLTIGLYLFLVKIELI